VSPVLTFSDSASTSTIPTTSFGYVLAYNLAKMTPKECAAKTVRSGDVRRLQHGMKIRYEVARGARHMHRCASAQMIGIKKSSRTVVSANTSEFGNLRKNGAHSSLHFGAPDLSIVPVTRLENYRRAAGAAALEKHSAFTADVDKVGKIAGRADGTSGPPIRGDALDQSDAFDRCFSLTAAANACNL
jgi:hypothetical protein